jgi:hypothetical protein
MQRINERMLMYVYVLKEGPRGLVQAMERRSFFLKPKQVSGRLRQEDEGDNKESRHIVPRLEINRSRYLEMVKTMMYNPLKHSGSYQML